MKLVGREVNQLVGFLIKQMIQVETTQRFLHCVSSVLYEETFVRIFSFLGMFWSPFPTSPEVMSSLRSSLNFLKIPNFCGFYSVFCLFI